MAQEIRTYVPREFVIKLPDIDLRSVSSENFYLESNGKKIDTKIDVERRSKQVRFLPMIPYYEEFEEYRIILDKTLKFITGDELLRKFSLSFKISGGKIYSRDKIHSSGVSPGKNYFENENILGHNITVYIHDIDPNAGGATAQNDKEDAENFSENFTRSFVANNARLRKIKSNRTKRKVGVISGLLLILLIIGGIFYFQGCFSNFLNFGKRLKIDLSTLSSVREAAEPSDMVFDDIKELVEFEGGKIDGVLRCSIMWNDTEYNSNDFDVICAEPGEVNYIYHANKENSDTTGNLDVDVINPERDAPAVENIAWSDADSMLEGTYAFYVNNYTNRGGESGFKAEIEFDGESYYFEYTGELSEGETVKIAEVTFDRVSGFEIVDPDM